MTGWECDIRDGCSHSHKREAVWHLRFRGDAPFGNLSLAVLSTTTRRGRRRGARTCAGGCACRRGRSRRSIARWRPGVHSLLLGGKAAFSLSRFRAQQAEHLPQRASLSAKAYLSSRLDDVLGKFMRRRAPCSSIRAPELRAAKCSHGVPNSTSRTIFSTATIAVLHRLPDRSLGFLAQAGLVDGPEIRDLRWW